jgi:hypothetical protein
MIGITFVFLLFLCTLVHITLARSADQIFHGFSNHALTPYLLPRGGSEHLHQEDPEPHGFRILSETVLHDNWRRLVSRKVKLPNEKIADFEIVSQGDRGRGVTDQAVLVFVWNSQTKTATMIKEYMPSPHKLVAGMAAGMVEDKHENEDELGIDAVYTAAVHELEEECRLHGGTWHRLCQPCYMDKYCTTQLSVYLVIDPIPVDEAACKPRDETEQGMEIIHGVTVTQLEEVIETGGMTVVGGWAAGLAIRKLQSLGEILL